MVKVVESADIFVLDSKHPKKANISGLQKDWRKHISTSKFLPTVSQPDEDNMRILGEEENVEQLQAVKNSKLLVKLKINNIDLKTVVGHSGGISFRKLPVACLPLPTGIKSQEYWAKWKEFKATTINLAASVSQLFSANALLLEYLQDWWDSTYKFSMEKNWTCSNNPCDTLPAIVEQTSKVVTEWHSSIGKKAINILTDLFTDNKMLQDKIVKWVEDTCGKKGEFHWVYLNPDAPLGMRSAFQSNLVLEIFSFHLKQAAGTAIDHGTPIGGLALCTAAMEHALGLWANGEDPKKKVAEASTSNSKK
ncbi:hypothetical protein C0991_010078 [Blastosporella zonata]|nr:hypothetical protein C0991_010078 [Blastosporella zonata]